MGAQLENWMKIRKIGTDKKLNKSLTSPLNIGLLPELKDPKIGNYIDTEN